jgi:limonene-1,2-epoxide hydrolase
MPTNIATEVQMVSAEQQAVNIEIVRAWFDDKKKGKRMPLEHYFSEKARIWSDSRPSDNPVVWGQEEVFIGPDGMRKLGAAYSGRGFTYEEVIHSIHACGPLVFVNRTDIRKQEGHPDKPIPAVGIFAVRDGKIIQWSDYYR